MNIPVLGLTGGIASGKSTASAMFRELGVRVIDADVIAREIVEPGTPGLEAIREAFGPEVIDEDGRLDREKLGAIIFEDADARAQLSAITHPRIGQRMMELTVEAAEQGEPWVIYDAALIVENNLHEALDALIVVSLPPALQIERLMARDGMDEQEAQSRLDAQMPLSEKLAVADYVVDNSGSLEQTRQAVEALYTKIDAAIEARGTARQKQETR